MQLFLKKPILTIEAKQSSNYSAKTALLCCSQTVKDLNSLLLVIAKWLVEAT